MTTDQPASTNNLRKLTQEEFIDIITLKDQEKYAEFYGKWEAKIQTFAEAIIIKDVSLESIRIIGVAVQLPLIIVSGLFEGFTIEDGQFYKEFIIEGGQFAKGFFISNGNFHREFLIYDGEIHQPFRIKNGIFYSYFFIRVVATG